MFAYYSYKQHKYSHKRTCTQKVFTLKIKIQFWEDEYVKDIVKEYCNSWFNIIS